MQTEGVGTKPIDDNSPLSHAAIPHLSPDETSSEDSDSGTSDSSDSEDDEVAETSTDDDDASPPPPSTYFNQPPVSSPRPFSSLEPTTPEPSPTPPLATSSYPEPPFTSPSQIAPHSRRGLSLPGFMKRTGSSKSVSTTSSLRLAEDSDPAASTSADNTDHAPPTSSAPEKKKRFSRRKKDKVLVGGEAGVGIVGAGVAPRMRKRSQKKRTPGQGKTLGRRGTKRDYRYEDDGDLFGLVQIEVKGATDLPKFKNCSSLMLHCRRQASDAIQLQKCSRRGGIWTRSSS